MYLKWPRQGFRDCDQIIFKYFKRIWSVHIHQIHRKYQYSSLKLAKANEGARIRAQGLLVLNEMCRHCWSNICIHIKYSHEKIYIFSYLTGHWLFYYIFNWELRELMEIWVQIDVTKLVIFTNMYMISLNLASKSVCRCTWQLRQGSPQVAVRWEHSKLLSIHHEGHLKFSK